MKIIIIMIIDYVTNLCLIALQNFCNCLPCIRPFYPVFIFVAVNFPYWMSSFNFTDQFINLFCWPRHFRIFCTDIFKRPSTLPEVGSHRCQNSAILLKFAKCRNFYWSFVIRVRRNAKNLQRNRNEFYSSQYCEWSRINSWLSVHTAQEFYCATLHFIAIMSRWPFFEHLLNFDLENGNSEQM